MTPIRWFPDVTRWIFGQKDGNQGYTDILKKFGTLLAQIGQIY